MAIPYVDFKSKDRAPRFRCWDPDSGDEEDGKDVQAWSPDGAAETYAEDRWSDMDNPDEQTICVRDADGKLSRFLVYAQRTVSFTAKPAEESEDR